MFSEIAIKWFSSCFELLSKLIRTYRWKPVEKEKKRIDQIRPKVDTKWWQTNFESFGFRCDSPCALLFFLFSFSLRILRGNWTNNQNSNVILRYTIFYLFNNSIIINPFLSFSASIQKQCVQLRGCFGMLTPNYMENDSFNF